LPRRTEMKSRQFTAYSIGTSMMEEAALFAAVRWLLPQFGIHIPLWALITMMVTLAAYACVTYHLNRKALLKKPLVCPDIGSRGITSTAISPKGYVRIRGELWQAYSDSIIAAGEEVTVTGMEGLLLSVAPAGHPAGAQENNGQYD